VTAQAEGNIPPMHRGGLARATVVCGAAVVIVVLLSACAGIPGPGSISGRADLYGRVPGDGQPLTIGAVHDGKVIATAQVRPGGRFNLAVPSGRYQVGLWVPGTRQLTDVYMTCATGATVSPGRSAVITLTCQWHSSGEFTPLRELAGTATERSAPELGR
jgi:hypothetical protein